MIGRWAVNGAGQLGRIESAKGLYYHGRDMQGRPWKSMAPVSLDVTSSKEIDAMIARRDA